MNRKDVFSPRADTICAIITPPGEAAIGVIRVSGPQAVRIAQAFFHSAGQVSLQRAPSHRVLFGKLIHPRTGTLLDEALCTLMRAPHSYTGEDVAEISCHGNPRLLSRILHVFLEEGARLAEPGEFTKRAFLNGKMDLTQAEGVMDTIRAMTPDGMAAAVHQKEGKLGKFLKGLRGRILSILAPIEARLDFPEEEIPETSRKEMEIQIQEALAEIREILKQASAGRILREGVSAILVGRPNVGKSSLFNALLGEGRAIVTEVPGTTRDTLEEWVEIRGIPVRLVDTAGIRPSRNLVEQMGILRSKEALAQGELVMLILDWSAPMDFQDVELLELARRKRSLVVLNKADLPPVWSENDVRKFHSGPFVKTSIPRKEGLEHLQDVVVEMVSREGRARPETPLIAHLRHQAGLERSCGFLEEALKTLGGGLPCDLAALDLRGAAEAIGEITGERFTEDLLDKIFSEFCVGK